MKDFLIFVIRIVDVTKLYVMSRERNRRFRMLLFLTGQQFINCGYSGRNLGGRIRKLDRGEDRSDDTHGEHDRSHENICGDSS